MARATYKLYFWTKAGRPSSIGRAHSFSLFYGKKRILTRERFPVRGKLKRYSFVESLVKKVEAQRKRALTIKRKKLAELKKKRAKPLKYEKVVKRRKIYVKKKVKRKKKTEIIEEEVGFAEDLETYSPEYTKSYYSKTLYLVTQEKTVKLKILDFTLKNPIPVDRYTDLDKVSDYMEELFWPHLFKFYSKYGKNSTGQFINRIKFSEIGQLRNGQKVEYLNGIGNTRTQEGTDFEGFHEDVKDLIQEWFQSRIKRYILQSIEQKIYITGFTSEVVIKYL